MSGEFCPIGTAFSRLLKLATLVAGLVLPLALPMLAGPAGAQVILHRGNSAEPQTLDQAHASIDIEANILKDLYEGLTVHDAAGVIQPGTAESWTISGDGLVYTFKLRDTANWSNGEPVTAGDFVFSFQRVEDPAEGSGYANILYPIKNAEAINTATPEAPVGVDTLGVRAIDDKTLEITLERPTPFFLELMAHHAALPVNRKAVDTFGAAFVEPGNMISNGAFMLTEVVANDHITVSKNPHYWGAADVKLDQVIFYPTDDQTAAVRRFQAGELDLNNDFPTDQLDALRETLGDDQVVIRPSLSVYYFAFDERQPPFDDLRVRRALSMAIDRDFLSESVFSGAQLPLYSFVPPGIAGYEPASADFASLSQLDREDMAKQLLAEAGYGQGGKPLNVEIRFNTNDNHQKVAVAIADMWKTLGASVTTSDSDTGAHYAYLQEGGLFNAARANWTADYADPENFLALYVSTNETFNYGGFDNAEYDRLLTASYTERDPAARLKLLHDAEAVLMAEQGVAPLMVDASRWLVSRKVKGWQENAVNDHLSRYLSIE